VTHLAWVHKNCKFVEARNRRVWEAVAGPPERWDLVKLAALPGDVQPYDVVLIRGTQIGESIDVRPAVVTRVMGDVVEVSPITGQFGLSSSSPGDFAMMPDHPDFGTTSMRKPSVVKDKSVSVSMDNVKRIGHLSGDMLSQYLGHTGREPLQKAAPRSTPKQFVAPRAPTPDKPTPWGDPKNFGVVKPAPKPDAAMVGR
jgi:hypothetical protein